MNTELSTRNVHYEMNMIQKYSSMIQRVTLACVFPHAGEAWGTKHQSWNVAHGQRRVARCVQVRIFERQNQRQPGARARYPRVFLEIFGCFNSRRSNGSPTWTYSSHIDSTRTVKYFMCLLCPSVLLRCCTIIILILDHVVCMIRACRRCTTIRHFCYGRSIVEGDKFKPSPPNTIPPSPTQKK